MMLAALVLVAPNVYAAAESSKKTSSSSLANILGFDPNAKDSTGTTSFDAAAPAFISKCNESTSVQSDVMSCRLQST